MFQFGGFSGDAAIQGSQQLNSRHQYQPATGKRPPRSTTVVTQTYTSSAISDSGGDSNESAIDDDDDDGKWEEEFAEESGSSMAEDNINFRRVDSNNKNLLDTVPPIAPTSP
jgi:hypothetical protein